MYGKLSKLSVDTSISKNNNLVALLKSLSEILSKLLLKDYTKLKVHSYMICKYHWTGLCRPVWCNSTHFEFSFVKVFREKTPKRSLYLHNPILVGTSIRGWQTTQHYIQPTYSAISI